MLNKRQKHFTTKLSPGRIVSIYAITGILWILLGGLWVEAKALPPEQYLIFETVKGLLYVTVTAALLWWLCRSWSCQIRRAVENEQNTLSQYESYVKDSPISITVMDQKGNILEANQASETLTGYRADELEAMNIFDLDATKGEDETLAVFAEIFSQGHANNERIIQCKDGSHSQIMIDGVRHGSDRAICFARDITARIQNERKLKMLNAMLRAIRRVNKAITEVTDVERLIHRICDILTEDRDFKHAWIALMDTDSRPKHYCDAPDRPDALKLKAFLDEGKLPQCLSSAETEDGLILAQDPARQCPDFPVMAGLEDCALLGMHFNYDHREGYIALMANPAIIQDEEEINLFREVCEDLKFALHTIRVENERKQALEDLISAKVIAEDANKAKDDFLAVMSHELRTPLNPIIGFSEMLLEETTTEPNKTYIDTILKAGTRQLEMIDDILEYMRLQRGTVRTSPKPVQLVKLCQSILNDTSVKAGKLDLRFVNGTRGNPVPESLEVLIDELILHRILDNLLGNACKYTKEGHVILGLSQAPDKQDEYIFTVEDTGIGIAPETQGMLFHAFSQADSSYTRQHEGVGLGLAICKKLADLLDGEISVESSPAEGSTFELRLPLALKDASTTPAPKEPPEDSKVRLFDRSLKILAVDDKADNLLVLEKFVKRAGGQVSRAVNGNEAVESCRNKKFDVILMDVAMPVMNGLEAAEAIRADGLNAETPIIAVTADARPELRKSCQEVGMQTILTKPIHARQLIDAIEQSVSQ